MSPCTKRLQRKTRNLAPFSGLKLIFWAWAAGAKLKAPAPNVEEAAATVAVLPRKFRRLNLLMNSLLWMN